MPKQTREDLFRNALQDFLCDLTVKKRNINEGNTEEKYSIHNYKLNCLTTNKNKSTQEYELNIPSSVITAYWDRTETENGEEIWLNSEPIYGNQETPLLYEFIESFESYFQPYKLTVGGNRLIPVSYMSLINLPRIQTNRICDTNLKIKVVYYKTHTPFPRPLTILEEKDREIRFLEAKLQRKM